ncbi:MAG: hypothetical protein QXQ81_08300, partial [Candidatus Thorarchaeota archaeon]
CFLPPGRRYFLVKPILRYRRLGLQEIDVLVEIDRTSNLPYLEAVAERHPYTGYRSRCFGSVTGLLIQFRTPFGTSDTIRELLDTLRERGYVRQFHVLPTSDSVPVYTCMSTEGWDRESRSWVFNWQEWFSTQDDNEEPVPTIMEHSVDTGSLTREDLHIISELMHDARRKNVEIMEALTHKGIDLTPQTFGRHLRMIQENYIAGYRVTFDPVLFEALSSVMVYGRGDEVALERLSVNTRLHPPPFESTQRIRDDNLFWFIRLPQGHISPFLNGLLTILDEMRVCLLDYTHSRLYYIYPEAFDSAKRSWITDREFMVDTVLSNGRHLPIPWSP